MSNPEDMTHRAAQALAALPIRGHGLTVDDLIIIWLDGHAAGHRDGMIEMSDRAIDILNTELARTGGSQEAQD
ncbi:hypothetical protein [Bifidobacterium cuniculi]|uniref:Uncharacterized protein n=1 Tax=Bifidobacterium cuniculi TaxID=1688 RepID=A0A087B4F8_9BIFI|nr:hypothetical protein [Bifidobacterium cuniculi]KFI65908.1 hypothetical protein BCUN_0407 [Bifidobacterium cuniculi]